jgi:hypothetical protein
MDASDKRAVLYVVLVTVLFILLGFVRSLLAFVPLLPLILAATFGVAAWLLYQACFKGMACTETYKPYASFDIPCDVRCGRIGRSKQLFEFSPLSNAYWHNAQCVPSAPMPAPAPPAKWCSINTGSVAQKTCSVPSHATGCQCAAHWKYSC